MKTKKSNWLKILIGIIASLIILVLVIVGGYVAYISIQYYRIEDNLNIEITNNPNNKVLLNTEYSISTYNIGFGAYTKDFSFFMDWGETKDGKTLQGTGSTAKNKETVISNTKGAIDVIKDYNVDFALFQEVDIDADRSHHYNQYKILYQVLN